MALGFLSRLKSGLTRSTQKLAAGITDTFTKRKLDDAALEELEDLLITADLGPAAAARVIRAFRRTRFGQDVSAPEIRASLAEEVAKILAPVAQPLAIDRSKNPFVILMVGVNGTGKTTTIGKLAQSYAEAGARPLLVAGDTFRAAAVEQLQVWGERTGAPVMTGPANADPAGLAFDAIARARRDGHDIVLIDTAGRLHNKAALMEELRKIIRVIRKQDETAPHAVLLTLDATTGQNAISQARLFNEAVDVTGLALTKLDGTAKGGIVINICHEFNIPIRFIGIGEQMEDLRDFEPNEFVEALFAEGEA